MTPAANELKHLYKKEMARDSSTMMEETEKVTHKMITSSY